MTGAWLGYGLILVSASLAGGTAGLVLAWLGVGRWVVAVALLTSWLIAGLLVALLAATRPARRRPAKLAVKGRNPQLAGPA